MSETAFPPLHRWRADWIWADAPGQEQNVYYYFRREFELGEAPAEATVRICADTRYVLSINGVRIGRGPVQSQPFHQYYDTHEVAAHLVKGTNCVAVTVNHLGTIPNTRGGLLLELEVDDHVVVRTDRDWRVSRAMTWRQDTFRVPMQQATPFQEMYDSRQAPEGWREAGFDDGRWPYAAVIGKPPVPPWTRLVPRDIPAMTEELLLPEAVVRVEEAQAVTHRQTPHDLSRALSTTGDPLRLTRCDNADALTRPDGGAMVWHCSREHLHQPAVGVHDPTVLLDFGRILTAYLELEVEGPAGAIVDMGFVERLTDGRFVNAIEGQFAARLTLRGGRQTFRTFNWMGFRFVKLRLLDCQEECRVHRVRAVDTHYPFEEVGAFACPDERLNRIWEISRATIQLCCNEFITDTPWREQGQWLGDVSAVTLGGIYACYGDSRLPAKFLRQSAANQLPTGLITNMTNTVSFSYAGVIPDYSLWWLRALWEHYLYTGDASWIHRFYPHALKIVFAFLDHTDAEGLLDRMPGWVFIDWAHVDKEGASAPLNAIFYGAMGDLLEMAVFKQDDATAELLRGARDRLRAAFVPRFYDAARECLVDANLDGVLSEHVSEHANLMPILVDLVDAELAATLIDRLYVSRQVSFTIAEPFFTWQVLKSLDHAGRFDLALAIVRERWGWMLDRGATSVSEEWGIHGSWRYGDYLQTIIRTESHAWSACPAEFLIRTLLGLEIMEPGCRRLRLHPRVDVLPDFRVSVPTPHGTVEVESSHGSVRWQAPDSVTVELA